MTTGLLFRRALSVIEDQPADTMLERELLVLLGGDPRHVNRMLAGRLIERVTDRSGARLKFPRQIRITPHGRTELLET
jgi:hypothetical protein